MENGNKFSSHPEVLISIAEYFAEIIFNELPNKTPRRNNGEIIYSDGKIDQREYTYRTVFEMDIDRREVSMTFDLGDRDFKDVNAKYGKFNHSDIATLKQIKKMTMRGATSKSILVKILFESLGMQELPAYSENDFRQFSDALAPHLKREILKYHISLYGINEVKVYFDAFPDTVIVGYDYYRGEDAFEIERNVCNIEFIKKEVVEEPTTPQSQAEYRKSKLKSW